MKLYNHTKIDDDLLKKVILEASKAIGAAPKTRHVPVKATTGKRYNVKGIAYKGREVSEYFMNKRQGYKYWEHKMLKANGYMALIIPIIKSFDPLKTAESIFSIAAHEWRHIRDYQKGIRFDSHKVVYHDRCQEVRAKKSGRLSMLNLHKSVSAQEAVLNLAINIDEIAKEKKRLADAKWEKSWMLRQERQERQERQAREYRQTAHGKRTASILTRIARETREAYNE